MDLVHGIANVGDAATESLGAAVAVLVPPWSEALLGRLRIAGTIRRELVLDHAEESVLGPEHVAEHLAQLPLALARYPIEILIA